MISAEDLANEWGIPLDHFHKLRRRHNWPHVKFGYSFRFTPEQVAYILDAHTITPAPAAPTDGRTALSAARSKA